MSIFDRKRKGMIYLTKTFNRKIDGPYGDEYHKLFSRHDRMYVRNRISDALIAATSDGSFISEEFDIYGDFYCVFVYVKKGSKKEQIIKDLGFVEIEAG